MIASVSTVRLSSKEMFYLKNTAFLGEALARIIDAADVQEKDVCVVHVSQSIAEEFRSAFTDRLARTGFNSTYDLTREGELLEQLIDKFSLLQYMRTPPA